MWTSKIVSIVVTKIKYGFSAKLKKKYPELTVMTGVRESTDCRFPSVRIRELPGVEEGMTLDPGKIAAVTTAFQIDVTDDKSMETVREVMDEILLQAKKMRFEIVTPPNEVDLKSPYRAVMRIRRLIAEADKL